MPKRFTPSDGGGQTALTEVLKIYRFNHLNPAIDLQVTPDQLLELRASPKIENILKYTLFFKIINQIRNMCLSRLLQNITAMGIHCKNT